MLKQILFLVFFNCFLFHLRVLCANQKRLIFHTIEEIQKYAEENCLDKQCEDVLLQSDPNVEDYEVIKLTYEEVHSEENSEHMSNNKHEDKIHVNDGHTGEQVIGNRDNNWFSGTFGTLSSGTRNSLFSSWSGGNNQATKSVDTDVNGLVSSASAVNKHGGQGNANGWNIGLGSLRGINSYTLLKPVDNVRKIMKRTNNILDTANDINAIKFHQTSQGYKDFQRTLTKRTTEEAPGLVPLVNGLNQIGSAIDNTNTKLINSAHSALKASATGVRESLDKLKPWVKDPNRPKNYSFSLF